MPTPAIHNARARIRAALLAEQRRTPEPAAAPIEAAAEHLNIKTPCDGCRQCDRCKAQNLACAALERYLEGDEEGALDLLAVAREMAGPEPQVLAEAVA